MSHDQPTTPPGASAQRGGTYEMLWDCKFCGTEKLLAVTHRHCPNCGAAQDPAARYLPAFEDRVALTDHKFVGADVICPACQQPNSAAAKFCVECGADLATGEHVTPQAARELGQGVAHSDTKRDLVKDQFDQQMASITSRAPEPVWMGLPRRVWLIGGGVLLLAAIIGGIIFAVTYRSSAEGEVTRLSWERTIEIEAFEQVNDEAWDDQVPGDAYSESCSRRQRGTERVAVGSHRECREVPQGDGSFREECNTVTDYEDRPVYDDWCRFTVDRWIKAREVNASGEGTNPPPEWPSLQLASGVGRYGQEREGDRDADYRVHIREDDGDTHTCNLAESEWMQYAPGMRVSLKTTITGGADCGSLNILDS